MIAQLQFATGSASESQIGLFLVSCDRNFVPPLSGRVDITTYAKKIADHAKCFEAWCGDELVGLVAAYCNSPGRRTAYITSVSVLPQRLGRGIAVQLMERCIDHVRGLGFEVLELEVANDNLAARNLYKKFGFTSIQVKDQTTIMALNLIEK